MMHIRFLILVTVALLGQACSRDALQRRGYSMLQTMQGTACRHDPTLACPPQESYDAYQHRYKDYLQATSPGP
jgi:hypothetical protein